MEVNLLNSVKIDEFLQKPVSLEKLTEIIGNMLEIYNKSLFNMPNSITGLDV